METNNQQTPEQQATEQVQQPQQENKKLSINDLTEFFMPKSLKDEEELSAEPEAVGQEQQTIQQPTEPSIDIPEIEPPPPQTEANKPQLEAIKQEAELIVNLSNEAFKQATGVDYDPLTATAEEQELFNRIKEEVRNEINAYKQQQQSIARMMEWEQKFIQSEPKWQEIVNYIQTEKPAKVLIEIQDAISRADVDRLNKLMNDIRKEFYTKQSMPADNTQRVKQTPEPPFVEGSGTEPPVVQKEFNPRNLRRVSSFEERVKMIPVEILAPKHILEN